MQIGAKRRKASKALLLRPYCVMHHVSQRLLELQILLLVARIQLDLAFSVVQLYQMSFLGGSCVLSRNLGHVLRGLLLQNLLPLA